MAEYVTVRELDNHKAAQRADTKLIRGDIKELTVFIQDFAKVQQERNIRCEMDREEQARQLESNSERTEALEQKEIKNGPVIAFAAKLQSNMSKITLAAITTILGSYGINLSNAPADPAPTVKESKKDDSN